MTYDFRYLDALINTEGNTLPGYYAKLFDSSTLEAVPLASDPSGTPIVVTSGLAFAAKTDDAGNLDFWVSSGTYHLDIYASDGTTFVRRFKSVPMIANGGGGDAPSLIDDGTWGNFTSSDGAWG